MSDKPSKPVINKVKDAKNVIGAHKIEKIIIEAEKSSVYVPRMAPPVLPALTGRQEAVHKLVDKLGLEKNLRSLRIISLQGMGGVGKTALAAAVANQTAVEQSCMDGTLWVSLGPTPDLMSLLEEWGEQFDEDLSNFTSPAARSRALSGILYNKKILIVVDDVWRTADARLFLVGGRKCRALVTTRNADVARALAGQWIYPVETLSENDSAKLLKKLAPGAIALNTARTRSLIIQLGGLPLGLTIAGGLLAEESEAGLGVKGILNELQEREKRLKMSSESQSLDSVVKLSYEWLSDETYQQVFRFLAIFGGRPNTFSLRAAIEICGVDSRAMRKAIVALVNRALLEVVAEERYAFHALIADFASTLLSKDDENGIYLRHAKYFLKTAKKYTSQNIKNWHKFDLDWNNVRLSLNWLIANTEFSDLGDRVKLELIADFAIALNTLIQIRKPLEGLGWLQAGEQACSLLRRSKDSGWLLLTIGLIELDAGCFDEAITHFEKCETIFESVAETQGLNYVRGNLGLVHHKRGEYSKALQVYEQVLELYQTADDIYASAVICCNQADVYYLIGDLPKAQSQLTKGIALARQKVADTQDLLVKALALNARIQLQCGTVSAAFENSQEAYSIAAQTGSNMLIGVANQSLGEVWASKGDAKIADQRFQKSIELLTEARVQEELAEAKLAYGNFLASNKRKQDAERNLSSAMHIFAQIGAHSRAEKINDILKDLGKK